MSRAFHLLFFPIAMCLIFIQCKEAVSTKEAITESVKEVVEQPVEVVKESVKTMDSINTESTALGEIAKVEKKEVEKEDAQKTMATIAAASDRKKEPEAPKKKKKRSKIKFEETVHKFGTIKTGDKVNHKFKFKNIGAAPLVIKNVDVSCGCTFPSYPFLPIKPGESGEIDVTFNSEHKLGRQKPTVTVVTNGRPRTLKLHLEGFVE